MLVHQETAPPRPHVFEPSELVLPAGRKCLAHVLLLTLVCSAAQCELLGKLRDVHGIVQLVKAFECWFAEERYHAALMQPRVRLLSVTDTLHTVCQVCACSSMLTMPAASAIVRLASA